MRSLTASEQWKKRRREKGIMIPSEQPQPTQKKPIPLQIRAPNNLPHSVENWLKDQENEQRPNIDYGT